MKVILSRKGFDSSNGGCASPILPDDTMLSIPIPNQNDTISYRKLQYNGLNYLDLLGQINPKRKDYTTCHLDPDIRSGVYKNQIEDWKPAFGQIGSAQGVLRNANISEGDLFLFFGWFHKTKHTADGYVYISRNHSDDFYETSGLHVIYGYMQIGKIITDPLEIKKYSWHPHASKSMLNDDSNTLYIPSKSLSFSPNLPGYGTLNYRKDRVLTMEGQSKSKWVLHPFLMPDRIYGNRRNSSKTGGLYYAGIWQELVVSESPELLQWANSIII